MAFCRFSDSDLYAYEDVAGGYTLHVAGARWEPGSAVAEHRRKLVEWCNLPPETRGNTPPPMLDWSAMGKPPAGEATPINHPDAGKSWHGLTAQELLDTMLDLKAKGFNVPDYAIDGVRGEIE